MLNRRLVEQNRKTNLTRFIFMMPPEIAEEFPRLKNVSGVLQMQTFHTPVVVPEIGATIIINVFDLKTDSMIPVSFDVVGVSRNMPHPSLFKYRGIAATPYYMIYVDPTMGELPVPKKENKERPGLSIDEKVVELFPRQNTAVEKE